MAGVLRAVRRLPRAEREAVALCLWSGVSYPDGAAVLGITEVAVRSRVSRARTRLAARQGGPMTDLIQPPAERDLPPAPRPSP